MAEVIKVEDCGENIGDYGVQIYNAILVPENATNGDMIEAMFPNGDLHDYDYYHGCVIYELNYRDFKFDRDWWYAPFKAEQEVD